MLSVYQKKPAQNIPPDVPYRLFLMQSSVLHQPR
nr:MAG TPA: hypothetical protein [Caudoviricetes sp.]